MAKLAGAIRSMVVERLPTNFVADSWWAGASRPCKHGAGRCPFAGPHPTCPLLEGKTFRFFGGPSFAVSSEEK
jgi:hypothetical protein